MFIPKKQRRRILVAGLSCALVALVGGYVVDYRLRDTTLQAPRAVFKEGTSASNITLVFLDGVQGNALIRTGELDTSLTKLDRLYVVPEGEAYNRAFMARSIFDEMRKRGLRRVILIGTSMGMAVHYKLLQLIEEAEDRGEDVPEVVLVLGIDPLWGGANVKNKFGYLMWAWKPGPIQSWIFQWLPGAMVGNDSPSDGEAAKQHHEYGRKMSFQRWGNEVAAAMEPAPTWRPKHSYPIELLISEEDEVLDRKGWTRYFAAFGVPGKRPVYVTGTHHAGIAEQPEQWRAPFLRILRKYVS